MTNSTNYPDYAAAWFSSDGTLDESELQPATDVDMDSVKGALLLNIVVCLCLVVGYEILRRIFPTVYIPRTSQSRNLYQNEPSDDPEINRLSSSSSASLISTFSSTQNSQESIDPSSTLLNESFLSSEDIDSNISSSMTPFDWIFLIYKTPWLKVRKVGGLDSYFFLRYIRMCLRITSISAFWGIIILFPTYSTGQNNAQGWYHFSIANVASGSWRIWVATLHMYLFSGFTFFVMKREYKHYVALRLDFLGRGSVKGVHSQHQYSVSFSFGPENFVSNLGLVTCFCNFALSLADIYRLHLHLLYFCSVFFLFVLKLMVERIPKELMNDEALKGYFEKLFPDRVHSASVLLKLPALEILSQKKEKTLKRLEKSIAYFESTGVKSKHFPRCFYFCYKTRSVQEMDETMTNSFDDKKKRQQVDSITYYTEELMSINREMLMLQQQRAKSAECGNNSYHNTTWFSTIQCKVGKSAGKFIDDSDFDNGLHTSIKGVPSWMDDASKKLKNGSDNKDTVGRKDGSPSGKSMYMYGSLDCETESNRNHRHYRKQLKNRDKSTSMTNEKISNLHLKDAEWYTKQSTSQSHRNQPLFTDRFMNEEQIEELEQPRNKDNSNDTIENKDHQSRGCLDKYLGRLGLDFIMAGVKMLNHRLGHVVRVVGGTETSSTGFITFLDLESLTIAASAPLTHEPNMLHVTVAPEARDIVWKNAHFPDKTNCSRTTKANFILALGAILWSIPLAAIQAVSSAENVAQIPGMSWILTYDSGSLKILINAYLPVIALLGLILLLPKVFEWIAISYERRKTKSDIQRSIVSRYFYYQIANIYITVTAGSLWKSASSIIDHPQAVLEILGKSLPAVVGYFISLLITKILAGLPMVILRIGALTRYLFLRLLQKKRFLTQRELDEIDRPQSLNFGYEYPTQLLVIVICFTYASISPLILVFGAFYFAGALMVYKKQILCVYVAEFDTGGSLFPLVCDRTLFGLICGQLTFVGYTLIRSAFYQQLALWPLPVFTYWVKIYFQEHYSDPSNKLTLDRAVHLDECLSRVTNDQSLSQILKRIFSKDYYKQLVLTEIGGIPYSYRRGKVDSLTKEVESKLRSSEPL